MDARSCCPGSTRDSPESSHEADNGADLFTGMPEATLERCIRPRPATASHPLGQILKRVKRTRRDSDHHKCTEGCPGCTAMKRWKTKDVRPRACRYRLMDALHSTEAGRRQPGSAGNVGGQCHQSCEISRSAVSLTLAACACVHVINLFHRLQRTKSFQCLFPNSIWEFLGGLNPFGICPCNFMTRISPTPARPRIRFHFSANFDHWPRISMGAPRPKFPL